MSDDTTKDEILTADEITELTDPAVEIGFDDGEFRIHDFAAGQSLSISKWTDLSSVTDQHAEALSEVLSSEFGVQISVRTLSREYVIAQDLQASFPDRLCLISTPTNPFCAELHLLLPGDFLTSLVNHYFGGGSVSAPKMLRRVTPSEQRIGERISKSFFRAMAEIWSDRVQLEFGDLFVDITPDRFSMIPQKVGFVIFPFEVCIGEDEPQIFRLLFPFEALENFKELFTPNVTTQTATDAASEWEPDIKAILPDVSMEVRGELCQISSTLRALLQMQVGSTIPISEPSEVKLRVEGRVMADGRYGAFDGFKAMQFNRFRETE